MSQDAEAAPDSAILVSSTASSSSDSSHESAASSTSSQILVPTTGEREYFCGIGKCRPQWIQVFRSTKFFTFILCLNSVIEGALVSGKPV